MLMVPMSRRVPAVAMVPAVFVVPTVTVLRPPLNVVRSPVSSPRVTSPVFRKFMS